MTPARRMWTLFEPLHAVTYFAPEGRAAFEAAGLRGFWRGYFASRSAPLGRAPAAVTIALYANFAPRMVERAIPSVWELASPEQALSARLEGSVAALSRLLDGQDVDEAASILQTVAAGAPTSGRALGAANAALPWPDEPLAVLWQAATVLRELRGDGHVLAQLAVGLDGLSTMVLRSGHDLARDALQPNRGWTDDEWAAAAELPHRTRPPRPGRADHRQRASTLLDRAEALTDELAQEPWTLVGDQGRRALRRARHAAGRCRAYGAAAGQPDRAAGAMTDSYVERLPAPELAGVVRTVWIQQTGPSAYVQRHLPTGGVELHLPIGSDPQLVGPLTGPIVEVIAPHTTLLGVRFLPGAAPPLPEELDSLVDLRLDLKELWGSLADRLMDDVMAAPSPELALDRVQAHLVRAYRRAGAGTRWCGRPYGA